MTITRDMLIQIAANSDTAVKEIGKARDEFGRFVKAGTAASQSLQGMEQAVNSSSSAILKQASLITDQVSHVSSSLSGLGAKAVIGNAVLEIFEKLKQGVEMLIEPIEESLHAFDEYRSAVERLTFSLAASGSYSRKSVEDFKEFADQLEMTTGASEEMTLQMIALAKNFGVTDERAKQMAKTANDIAATGARSAMGAFDGLMSTLKGVTRGVGDLDKSVIGLNPELAKQGAAIDILAKRYEGFGEQIGKTYAGKLLLVKNTTEQIFKAVGEILDQAFDRLGAADRKVVFLEKVLEQVKEARSGIIDFADAVKANLGAVAKAVSQVDFGRLGEALLPILGGIGSALLAIQAIKLAPLVIDLARMGVAAAASAGSMLLIGGAAVAAVAALDILVHNLDNLMNLGRVIGAPFVLAFKNLELVMRGLDLTFEDVLDSIADKIATFAPGVADGIKKGLEPLRAETEKRLLETTNEIQDLADKTAAAYKTINTGATGVVVGAVSKIIKDFKSAKAELVAAAQNKQLANEPTNRKQGPELSALSEENKKALDDLISKGKEAQKQAEQAGKSAFEIAQVEQDSVQKQIGALRLKLTAQHQISEEITKQLNLVEQQEDSARAAKQAALIKENYKAFNQTFKATQVGLDSFGKTQQEQIDIQSAAMLDQLETQKRINEEKFRGNQDAINQANALLDLASEQEKKKAANAKSVAPSKEFEAPLKVGQQIASTLSSGATGIMGSALGFAGAANLILDAVQALIDFIPTILSKVANVVNSLADLPGKLADGVVNINAALLKFVQSFLPNIISAAEKILESGISFFQQLPKVFQNLMKTLPEMLTKFVDKLPELVEETMRATIDALPAILGSLVDMMIKKGPAIGLKIAEAFILKVPAAIVRGVLAAIGDIGKMIAGSFTSKAFDTSGLTKGLSAITRDLGTQSSRLFSVIDASATARGIDAADKIASSIEGATNYAGNLLKNLWNALKGVWDFINTAILKPFLNLLQSVWNQIYANTIQPLLTGLNNAFNWVVANVLQPLASVVSTAFGWVVSNVLNPMYGVVTTAFNWVVTNIFNPMNGIVNGAFGFLRDVVARLMTTPAWLQNFTDGVFKFFNFPDWVGNLNRTVDKLAGGFGWIGDLSRITDKLGSINIGIGGGGGGGGGILANLGFKAEGGFIGANYAAAGLDVSKLARGNDRVPLGLVMGATDEFVLRGRATRSIGTDTLNYMNNTGRVPKGNTNIALGGITINSQGQKLDDAFIRQTFVPAVMKELKKASVDGRFVIGDKGIRQV